MNRKRKQQLGKLAFAALMGIAAVWLWRAQGNSAASQSPPQKGNLEVRIKDHREAIGDFTKLEVVIDTIRVSPKTGLKFWEIGWKELRPIQEKIDLTKYTGARAATVFRGDLTDGSFDAVDLKLKGAEGVLKKTGDKVSVKSFVTPIKLPFSTDRKNEILIIFDLAVLDVSDHPPGTYELHLAGYELYRNGKLIDKVPPA